MHPGAVRRRFLAGLTVLVAGVAVLLYSVQLHGFGVAPTTGSHRAIPNTAADSAEVGAAWDASQASGYRWAKAHRLTKTAACANDSAAFRAGCAEWLADRDRRREREPRT